VAIILLQLAVTLHQAVATLHQVTVTHHQAVVILLQIMPISLPLPTKISHILYKSSFIYQRYIILLLYINY
jgi:hypothetical protein